MTGQRVNAICLGLAVLLGVFAAPAVAGYKARRWEPGPVDSYPSRLESEGVTIAVQPLYTDELAGQAFDKGDMVTRGIMPVAIIVFNGNDFPVAVESEGIELITGSDHLRSMRPGEAVSLLFQKGTRNIWIPQPVPKLPSQSTPNKDASEDFDSKFLDTRVAPAKGVAFGFLYFRMLSSNALGSFLRQSRLLIPQIYRQDTGQRLLFFEVELEPSIVSHDKYKQ
jgi:hypothetical protein